MDLGDLTSRQIGQLTMTGLLRAAEESLEQETVAQNAQKSRLTPNEGQIPTHLPIQEPPKESILREPGIDPIGRKDEVQTFF